MDRAKFWSVVTFLGWGASIDYRALGRRYHAHLTAEERDAFEMVFTELHDALMAAVEAHEKSSKTSAGVGDDGFFDLCGHIIGLGQEVYTATMLSPALAVERGRKADFAESFAYVFQTDDSE